MSDDDENNRRDAVPELIEGRAESEALIVNPLIGKLLNDRFLVEIKVGEGGFGAVYRGTDVVTGRLVAIKFLLHTVGKKARQALARFQREATITGRLNHPFIIAIYESGIHDGCPYIVMEWVQGETLVDRLKRGPMPWQTLIKLLRDVASALAHAADHGVVHRDMKPDNIMIRQSTGTAVVLDFGIAATYELDEEGFSVTRRDRVTTLGLVMGTPDYISPESWAGAKALDGRADVYALGAMIYRALEGRTMWEIVPTSANDFAAFARLAEHARFSPRPLITAPVPEGIKVLYALATVADREDRPWPEGFLKACDELLASDGTTITLDARSRTVSARILATTNASPQVPETTNTPTAAKSVVRSASSHLPTRANTPGPAKGVSRPALIIGGMIGILAVTAIILGAVLRVFSKANSPTIESVSPSTVVPDMRTSSRPEANQRPTGDTVYPPRTQRFSPSAMQAPTTEGRKDIGGVPKFSRKHKTETRSVPNADRKKPLQNTQPLDDGIFD
jgi:serine/threonine protein kinase